MYKNVIAIGDSFMEGAEISWPLPDKKNVVGALLANRFNCDFYNLAQSGAGILSVLEQLKLAEEGGIATKDSFIIFSLPPSGRIDFPLSGNSGKSFVIDYWYHAKILDGSFELPIDPNIENDATYIRFKHLHQVLNRDPPVDLIKMGEQIHYSGITALLELLKKYPNVQGIIGHPQYCLDKYYREKLDLLLESQNILFRKEGFISWAKANNYTIMPYGHPGADAHQALADLIEKYV